MMCSDSDSNVGRPTQQAVTMVLVCCNILQVCTGVYSMRDCCPHVAETEVYTTLKVD